MNINKNTIIWLVVLALGVILIGATFLKKGNDMAELTPTPSASSSTSPDPSSTASPSVSSSPLPSVSSQVGATVPWNLLPKEASCTLRGEVRYLNANTYDNQDALFIYSGIDHPGRNIHWTVTPEDGLAIGPNIFTKMPIPNGESLVGVTLPANPKYKRYELRAVVDYGRLIDDKGNIVTVGGNVKVFQKQCSGKTTVILP